jgi:hypothetical protein
LFAENHHLIQDVLGRLIAAGERLIPSAQKDFARVSESWGVDAGASTIAALRELRWYFSWTIGDQQRPTEIGFLRDLLE